MATRTKERNTSYMRTYRAAKATAQCYDCKQPAFPGRRRCLKHLKLMREAGRRHSGGEAYQPWLLGRVPSELEVDYRIHKLKTLIQSWS